MIRVSDSEPIIEGETSREIAAQRIKSFRKRKVKFSALGPVTVRESRGPRYLPTGAFEFWWKQDVIRPAKSETQRRLYG